MKKKISIWTDVDHPLNNKGIEQAIALNKSWKAASTPQSSVEVNGNGNDKSDSNGENNGEKSENKRKEQELTDTIEFGKAEMIISSPLARALQTAYLALYDHPSIVSKGNRFVICRNAREIRQWRFDCMCVVSKYVDT